MPVHICPNCLQYYCTNDYDNDHVHRCNSGYDALDKEDRFIVGPYIGEKNENGEGIPGKDADLIQVQRDPAFQGIQNKLGGTFAGIQGQRLCSFTIRGNKAVYMRERRHYQYIAGLARPSSIKMEGVGMSYGRGI